MQRIRIRQYFSRAAAMPATGSPVNRVEARAPVLVESTPRRIALAGTESEIPGITISVIWFSHNFGVLCRPSEESTIR